ncbi:MAG: hypothetical protein COT17_08070 [Elusimicrobia bacterium CG08_land_8_20_14_0_20_51_18]|nr:MAG: hypothetical protein COT17_08070 [Elusimicrobia bacterium CG08_land_8_20_14_0_20_51_18]
MRDLIIISSEEKDRLLLRNILSGIGAVPLFALDLNEALNLLGKTSPRAVFIAESKDPPSEILLREIRRAAPLLPLVVLLRNRDASKAVELMKLGAFDCAQPPWTEEELLPLFKKSLSLAGAEIRFREPVKNLFLKSAVLSLALLAAAWGLFYLGRSSEKGKYEALLKTEKVLLPDKNISGIFFDGGSVYLTDWLLQSVYRYSKKDLKLLSVKKLPGEIPVAAADQPANFIVMNDDNIAERRLKDEKYTLLSRTRPVKGVSELCFDGMYLWTFDKKEYRLQKRMNNDALDLLAEFPLPSKNVRNLACGNKFLLYYDSRLRSLLKASPEDPQKILFESPLEETKIISMAYDGSAFWYVYEEGGSAFLKSGKIKDEI